MDIIDHKESFEELYNKLDGADDSAKVLFPLRDIGLIRDAFKSYYYRRFSVHILSRLLLEDEQKILVVGCGMGFDEKNTPSRFCLSIAEKLPFPDSCFDRVLSREVIEHVMDPGEMLKEIYRVLKPGGMAVITTENEDAFGLANYHDRIRPKITSLTGYRMPVQPYKDEAPTLSEMKRYVEDAGLTIQEIFYDGALYKLMWAMSDMASSERMVPVAHYFSCLENNRYFSRFFCDQVKYMLRKKGNKDDMNIAVRTPSYSCIKCRHELKRSEGALECTSCKAKYRMADGFPDFIKGDRSVNNGTEKNKNIPDKRSAVLEMISRYSYHVIDKIALLTYCGIYLATAILCTFTARKNTKRLSHILDDDDPFHKYLTLNKIS
jgi:hypothetical protein